MRYGAIAIIFIIFVMLIVQGLWVVFKYCPRKSTLAWAGHHYVLHEKKKTVRVSYLNGLVSPFRGLLVWSSLCKGMLLKYKRHFSTRSQKAL